MSIYFINHAHWDYPATLIILLYMGNTIGTYMNYIICTVDREIFTLKIIHIKNFHVDKFSWFRSICKNF